MSSNKMFNSNTLHDPVTGKLKGYRNPVTQADEDGVGGSTIAVASSRALVPSDNGNVLEMTAAGLTLTVNAGALPAGFACGVIPNGTTSIAAGVGVLLNGAGTTLTRADSANVTFGIAARTSANNSYVVNGS